MMDFVTCPDAKIGRPEVEQRRIISSCVKLAGDARGALRDDVPRAVVNEAMNGKAQARLDRASRPSAERRARSRGPRGQPRDARHRRARRPTNDASDPRPRPPTFQTEQWRSGLLRALDSASPREARATPTRRQESAPSSP